MSTAFDVAQRVWTALEPYHPHEFLPFIVGVTMVYCGGYYPLLIAAVEAFHYCGYHRTRDSLIQIYRCYQIAREASRKDDAVDDDNDGVADVLQISRQQLLTRKIGVVMRAIDPSVLSDAVTGMTSGCFAVLATLKVEMAHTVTLGAAIGDVFRRAAEAVVSGPLHLIVPTAYQRWIPVAISWSCRTAAVVVAYTVQRIISAAHSSLRGAQIIVRSSLGLLVRRQLISADVSEGSFLFTAAALLIAASGFMSQLRNGFGVPVPFPLSILLWPLSFAEWLIAAALYWTK